MDYEILKEDILKLGSGSLKVFGGTYEGGIYLQQVPDEITELLIFLLSENKSGNFLEIGSAAGGMTFLLNKYLKFDNIVIIDDNQHPHFKLREQILSGIKRTEYIGNSQLKDSIDFVENLHIKFDIIFIDADHSYNGVKTDTLNYFKFLKDDGYIVYHDTLSYDGVKRWNNELDNGFIQYFKNIKKIGNRLGLSVYKKIK
jgi:predicted O-methyltransferase YrrM